MSSAITPLPFPSRQPPGYEWLPDEVVFDASVHLSLEAPAETVMLTDLGYSEDEIANKASPIAASSPFRVLSDEGAAVMLETARRLLAFAKPAGDRIERVVRGGCYRSAWLRDLCISPDVTEHLAAVYGVPIAPHAMPLHLGHLNYEPTQVGRAVDKWHHDTLPLDYVLMVTNPMTTPGGRFEYFAGTKAEAAELKASGATPPTDRVVTPDFPGPGYAIALHGDMVVHRAAPLDAQAERITMVNGYVSLDATVDEQSRNADLIGVDDPALLWTEWARFEAWRARGRLDELIASLDFGSPDLGRDAEAVAARLDAATAGVQRAAAQMRGGPVSTSHYE